MLDRNKKEMKVESAHCRNRSFNGGRLLANRKVLVDFSFFCGLHFFYRAIRRIADGACFILNRKEMKNDVLYNLASCRNIFLCASE